MRLENNQNSVVLTVLLSIAKFAIICLSVLMVLSTLGQVVFRYVITEPLPWSEELARYCFVWIVFLGAAVGLSRGVHLGVDLFVNTLPERLRVALDVLTAVFISCFATLVIFASFPVISLNMFQHSPVLEVQMSLIYFAIPVSMAFILLISIERIVTIFLAKGTRVA